MSERDRSKDKNGGKKKSGRGWALQVFLLAVVLWHENRKWGIAAGCLAVLVAFSRMYLYVHYPTDILGGALLGAFAGWAGIRVSEWITEKRKGRTL